MNYQIANHFPAQFESGSIKEATILQCSDFVIDLQEKVGVEERIVIIEHNTIR